MSALQQIPKFDMRMPANTHNLFFLIQIFFWRQTIFFLIFHQISKQVRKHSLFVFQAIFWIFSVCFKS
jgi:hypothetical protein